jgi:Cu2+-exporting ATPase
VIGRGLVARVDGHEVHIGSARLMADAGIGLGRAQRQLRAREREGHATLLVAIDGNLAAAMAYADVPRRESAAVVRALRAGGRRTTVLASGDARGPSEAVGRRLGVDEVFSEHLPEEKAERVREWKKRGRVVAMVGDGINDAPALAVADVGISLGGATDVAIETADVVLLHGGIRLLPRAFAYADLAMGEVHRDLVLSIAPNALAIVFGALGFVPPSLAAAVNNGSTVAAAVWALAPLWAGGPATDRGPGARP